MSVNKRLAARYGNFLRGRDDRLAGYGLRSANGDYLDGYHADPQKFYVLPGFLTPQTEAILQRKFPGTITATRKTSLFAIQTRPTPQNGALNAMLRYTLEMYRDDMGTFTQPGCRDTEDALWHVNAARLRDGLRPLALDEFKMMLRYPRDSNARATLTPES